VCFKSHLNVFSFSLQLLIDRGCDVNGVVLGENSSPLHFASTSSVVHLLSLGGAVIDALNSANATPLLAGE
jgi:hypothetical protein